MSNNTLWEQTFQVSDSRTTKVLTVTGELGENANILQLSSRNTRSEYEINLSTYLYFTFCRCFPV